MRDPSPRNIDRPTLAPWSCGTASHFSRRSLLQAAVIGGVSWLTPLASLLAEGPGSRGRPRAAQSLIVLWLSGGPSQLETFDPHPNQLIAGGTRGIKTSAQGILLAEGLPQLAEQMDHVSLIRNVVSLEGDHERATYNVKTGYRPDPTIVHPSVGAVVCHELPQGAAEIPRHIAILPNSSYGRGGYLGQRYDAFRAYTTQGGLPDVRAQVAADELDLRLDSLQAIEHAFQRGRMRSMEEKRTLHLSTIQHATTMMSSEQLQAFDVSDEPASKRAAFGDSEFGRACLAAIRLTEVGVRCVEVTLDGWDSHFDNHGIHRRLNSQLDPAFAALMRELRARDRLEDTVVICGGEFGRTPHINPAEGRDHWPHGFSVAVAGGAIRPGIAVGNTDPEGGRLRMEQGTTVADVHATILAALGVQHDRELFTNVGRPIKLSEGTPIRPLISA